MANVKIAVYTPETHADTVRNAIGEAGGGHIGNYSHCTFSTKGTGRFKPGEGTNPHLGETGKIEQVEEEKIEFICPRNIAKNVIEEIKKAHPYEEVALDIYPVLDESEL